MFKPRIARRGLERYRSKGHDRLERRMVETAAHGGLQGSRVLEIGGGIGTMQAELLAAGAEHGEIVELVAAYAPYARELARERGLEARSAFRVLDVLDDPGGVEPADIVVLNRVVCCSPDGVRLTGLAARLARRTLVLSFPRDVFWIRTGIRFVNAGYWLRRSSFRVFAHRTAELLAAAEAEGVRVAESGRGTFWEFAALHRPT
jgi:hypothetical protein